MINRQLLILVLFFLCPTVLHAQEAGFDILSLGPGTYALGNNGLSASLAESASDMYGNPANLTIASSSNFSADYSFWISGFQNSHLAVNIKKENWAYSIGIFNSKSDDFQRNAGSGEIEENGSINYLSFATALSYRSGAFSFGATGQLLREQFHGYGAIGYALNGGITVQLPHWPVLVATNFQNIGRMKKLNMRATILPSEWRTGATVDLFTFSATEQRDIPLAVTASAEIILPLINQYDSIPNQKAKTYALLGANLEIAEVLSIYTGYRSGITNHPLGFGTRIHWDTIDINYAFIPFQSGYNTAHSVGLTYRF